MTLLLGALLTVSAVWLWTGPSLPVRRLAAVDRETQRPGHRLQTSLRKNPLVRRLNRRREEETWRLGVIELCDALAAELTAGRTPEDALADAVESLPSTLATPLRDILPAQDLPQALHRLSERPGAHGLRLLAACWRIGVERGATFAPVIDGLTQGLRDDHDHHRQIKAQLAGTHATARLLAVLPCLGLAMSWSLGADPLAFLFTTLPGLACLLLAVLLDAAGLLWTRRIATKAERP
ncbi:type II secretion system protein [Actinocorallia sp. B10E7]|uniref:type II secretion system F family protein n=1 Tax=Actinocorallia sp. B10E7 TaxID=3153558 RepID=UPI00325C5BF2